MINIKKGLNIKQGWKAYGLDFKTHGECVQLLASHFIYHAYQSQNAVKVNGQFFCINGEKPRQLH